MHVETLQILSITLTTMAFSIALFGAVSMLGEPAHRGTAWGLALFLGTAALDTLAALVGRWDLYPRLLWIRGLETVLTSIYGPANYLYVLTMTERPATPKLAALLLLGPLLVAMSLNSWALTLPRDVQLAMLAGEPVSNKALATQAGVIMIALQLVFLTFTFGLIVACWRALNRNLRAFLVSRRPHAFLAALRASKSRGGLSETMGLRAHRAISWIGRAGSGGKDKDACFIYLRIISRSGLRTGLAQLLMAEMSCAALTLS